MNKRKLMSIATRKSVLQFCNAYLPSELWYKKYFNFADCKINLNT